MMIRIFRLQFSILMILVGITQASATEVKGFSLTETDLIRYDANPAGVATPAQSIVDELYRLGVRHLNLSPRAVMRNPWSNEVIPVTEPHDRPSERQRYLRLIQYIHSKGMTVGIRPIFFVVDANGRTPYEELLPDGTTKIWWHGNIQPSDPEKWFDSFKSYLDLYLVIAKAGRVEEFTIGAELYSMTVGLEDQWLEHPFGFPARWLGLLRYVKSKLPAGCRVMYDINFTDAYVGSPGSGLQAAGGEIERWRYRLADLADPANPYWVDLADFWKELDAVGIDLYRSLASKNEALPEDYAELVTFLKQASDRYVSQLDTALFEIELAVGQAQRVILKEVGYRSVERGFIDPFVYDGSDSKPLNLVHQAAAYEALLGSFWNPGFAWFQGIVFWDASIDPLRHGQLDRGFSPIGKPMTEEVIQRYFR